MSLFIISSNSNIFVSENSNIISWKERWMNKYEWMNEWMAIRNEWLLGMKAYEEWMAIMNERLLGIGELIPFIYSII